MELDIERLHAVIEGKMEGVRGAGHTTALLIQVLQSAQVQSLVGPAGRMSVIVLNETMLKYNVDRAAELAYHLGVRFHLSKDKRTLTVTDGDYWIEVAFIPRRAIKVDSRRLLNYFLDQPVQEVITYEETMYLEMKLRD